MPTPTNHSDEVSLARKPRRVVGAFLVFAGVAVGIALTSLLAHMAVSARTSLLDRLASILTGRTTTIDVSSASVVEKIRKLSRLETVVYSIDKIVEGQRESLVLPNILAGDKLLLIAHGEVIAGIDLDHLKPGDVSVNGDHVEIHLPSPQLLSTQLDNQRTRVYSRDTGLLVTADPNLETEVRKAAEQQIGQAAIDDGILAKAKTNAQTSMTALLYGLGFHTVEVH